MDPPSSADLYRFVRLQDACSLYLCFVSCCPVDHERQGILGLVEASPRVCPGLGPVVAALPEKVIFSVPLPDTDNGLDLPANSG